MLDPKDYQALSDLFKEALKPLEEKIDVQITNQIKELKEQYERLEQRFDGMEQKLDNIEQRLDSVEQRLDGVEQQLDNVEQRLTVLEHKTAALSTDAKDLEKQFTALYNRMDEIQLILENDTVKRINIIAEGHGDLNEKLDRALLIEGTKEMLLLRIVALESEVRKIKTTLDQIA